jgi:hypothetical protein
MPPSPREARSVRSNGPPVGQEPGIHPASSDDGDAGPVLAVWQRLVSELASCQDASPGAAGSVVNLLCGAPYIVDTCCAAAVFAAEYQRTGVPNWRERASRALTAASGERLFCGVNEPTWEAGVWRRAPRSLPATAIAVDGLCDALDRLGLAFPGGAGEEFDALLDECRTKGGGFAHNPWSSPEEAHAVQNATAAALYVARRLSGRPRQDAASSLGRLEEAQLTTGLWPYYLPAGRERLRQSIERRASSVVRALGARGRAENGHGDAMHHLMTLYYVAAYSHLDGSNAAREALCLGWEWINRRLLRRENGSTAIVWSRESVEQFPNARDTNSYFLLVGALPHLASLEIVGPGEAEDLSESLLAHVNIRLLDGNGKAPCIRPYEASDETGPNVPPMFEQTVAWKARLMAGLVAPR